MNKGEADQILEKYLAGKASTEERALVEHWYLGVSNARKLEDRDDFEQLSDELWLGTKKRAGLLPAKMPVRKLWSGTAIAASLLLVLGAALWFYNDSTHHPAAIKVVVKDIAPVRNTATLTFANGRAITLSDAKTGLVVANDLTYNDGSFVTAYPELDPGIVAKDKVTQLTASTPRGGTYQITLPDGTRVWLNADSKLIFPSKFSASERMVQLTGEAYFEVAKLKGPVKSLRGGITASQNIPFLVISKNQKVEVLGTHFNINSYGDEGGVKTTLLEGSVKVTLPAAPIGAGSIVLKPGQQSVVNGNSEIKVTEADVELAMAWKNGLFYFKDADLKLILRTFSRWYDIDVVAPTNLGKRKFSGKLYRNVNAYQALQVLNLLGVDFNLEKKELKAPKKIIKP